MKRILLTGYFIFSFTFSFCQHNFTWNELENLAFFDVKQVEEYMTELHNTTSQRYSTIKDGYYYPKMFWNNADESIFKSEDFSINYSFKSKEWYDQLLSAIRSEPYYKERPTTANDKFYQFKGERFHISIGKTYEKDKKYSIWVFIKQGYLPFPTADEFVPAKNTEGNIYEVNSYTNITDISVSKGQSISFKAFGSILFGFFAGSGGIGGIDGYTDYNRVRGFKHGSLLARISDGEWIKVKNGTTILAEKNGILQFLVNDKDPSNNSGVFTVEISCKTPLKKINIPIAKKEQEKKVDTIKTVEPKSEKIVDKAKECETKGIQSAYKFGLAIGSFPIEYSGNLTNTSINRTASCKMIMGVKKIDNYNTDYRLTGSVDNINLVGKWDLVGAKKVTIDCIQMLEFIGQIDFGYEGTGYQQGTKAPFTIRVEVSKERLKGTYTIGAFSGNSYEQQGVFDLH